MIGRLLAGQAEEDGEHRADRRQAPEDLHAYSAGRSRISDDPTGGKSWGRPTTPAEAPGDNNARYVLARICTRLDGSKELVLALAAEGPAPPIVLRALDCRLTPRDLVQLETPGPRPRRHLAAALVGGRGGLTNGRPFLASLGNP